jgi:hypothetical protein
LIHVVLVLRREIRSGEDNRKKYGVPDVKMSEREKGGRVLIVFEIDRGS